MIVVTRSIAVLLIVCGIIMAGWGPLVFEVLSGSQLPQPVADDAVAMAIWSGVAFARVLGALLVCVGALLLGSTAANRQRAMMVGLLWSALLGTVVTASQQSAIWSNRVGYVLVALLLSLVVLAASRLVAAHAAETESAA